MLSQPLPAGGVPSTQNRPKKTWVPALEGASGFGLAAVLVAVAHKAQWIAAHIDPGVVPLLTLAGCYILYSIRHLRPLAYGMAEIMIGIMLTYAAMVSAPEGVLNDLNEWSFWLIIVARFAAGIYIIVRGLDNISQSRWIADHAGLRWFFECRWGGSGTRRS